MSAPKIAKMVSSCRTCPNRQGNECALVDCDIVNQDIVAPFCPLPDYPSRIIAGQEATISALNNPHKWGAMYAVLTHVAAKLKINFNGDRMTNITIPYPDRGEIHEVCFRLDHIIRIDVPSFVIYFLDSGDTFKLYVDGSQPALSRQVSVDPERWEQFDLKV